MLKNKNRPKLLLTTINKINVLSGFVGGSTLGLRFWLLSYSNLLRLRSVGVLQKSSSMLSNPGLVSWANTRLCNISIILTHFEPVACQQGWKVTQLWIWGRTIRSPVPALKKKSRWKARLGRGVHPWRDGTMGLTTRGFVHLNLLAVGLAAEWREWCHCCLSCTDMWSWDVPEVSLGGDLGHINVMF